MNFNEQFPSLLLEELKKTLPGEAAQFRMAPPYRPQLSKADISGYNPKIGAVLLLLYLKNGEFNIVFTRRMEYNGVHSAQMSLPGGKKEAGDPDLTATALRETYEEVGVPQQKVQILGQLSEVFIPPSNFLITPYVGFASEAIVFVPQQTEVAEIVEIPVAFLMDAKNINMKTEIKLPGNHTVQVPAYISGPNVIWGATAIILSEFFEVVRRIE